MCSNKKSEIVLCISVKRVKYYFHNDNWTTYIYVSEKNETFTLLPIQLMLKWKNVRVKCVRIQIKCDTLMCVKPKLCLCNSYVSEVQTLNL